MKTKFYLTIFLSILLASCSSLQSTVNDDLYYSPADEQLASNAVYDNPSYDKNESTIFSKKYDKEISDILEDTSKNDIDTTIYQGEEYQNPYDRIIVDDYNESWERRMEAKKSPYYGMNNYYSIYFSDDFWYAQSFFNDPYYNVIIVGDQIWVEPYWMSSWYYRPYGWYYNSYGYPYYGYRYYSYYSPYYYNNWYYNSWYYRPDYYHTYPYYNRTNYASSSFHSYRQRSLGGISGTRSTVAGSSRELPENYIGRDIRSSSTVKSGIDRQSARTVRAGETSATRTRTGEAGETIRVRESNTSRTGSAVRTSTDERSTTRNYTRPQQTSRSTYSSPSRSATRYNRPESSNVRSGSSSNGVSRSTYSPDRSGSSSTRSGSSYTPNRSTQSSGSSVNRSSTRSSGSSVRSSGSSTRSSGSSGRSSGSSNSSSSSNSRGGRR